MANRNPFDAPTSGGFYGGPNPNPYAVPGGYSAPPPTYGVEMAGKPPDQRESQVGKTSHLGVYQDVWAAVVFVVHLLVIGAVAIALGAKGINLTDLKNEITGKAPPPLSVAAPPPASPHYDIKSWAPQLGAAAVVASVFSWMWLQLMKLFPITMITVALWWGVGTSFALAAVLFATGNVNGLVGIILIVFAVLNIVYAIMVRNRIPFAGAMLSQVVSVVKMFPSTIWIAYASIIISLVWVAIWILGAAGAMSQSNSGLIVFGLLVSLYWTMEVIKNVVHVTCAGTVATYYFQRLNMPPNVTGKALGRAMTTSFGSICLGSFVVAVLNALREMIRMARASNDGNEILLSIADCILACIEGLVQFFNKWAYIQVAIYGKSFMAAARDTWQLFKAQGIEVLINDDLTSTVLMMGSVISGLVCALVGGGWTFARHRDLAATVSILSFFIGFFITALAMSVIESGVAAYYVCFAEDPAALERNDPAFYKVMSSRHSMLMQKATAAAAIRR
eukprot:TRINITY_DN1102_c0_g1_i1.p1 TRINITY_DN1102_c0_g1~~TRINITY_DN1102_c0_g1_i1.p1  ORF type:complete len:505 (+),score=102.97 TRINITY_DN1102_c0_g1_i1:166-1680(+)